MVWLTNMIKRTVVRTLDVIQVLVEINATTSSWYGHNNISNNAEQN